MIREIIQTLACLSVLNGSTLSLHLTNDRSADHSSSNNGGGGLPMAANTGGSLLQHRSNNPYRRMATAAESERMLMMGGGRRGRPIVAGHLHLTTGDIDSLGGGTNYQPSSLTMLQDNEFPMRREPFFFAGGGEGGDDDDDGGDGGGGGGGFAGFQHPQPDHYHRYDDGSFEIMEDIFNRGDGVYRKFPAVHHQHQAPLPPQYPMHEPSPRGLQELFDHHGDTAPQHRQEATSRFQQKMQRKRTQQKQALEKLPSPGSKPPPPPPAASAAKAEPPTASNAAAPSTSSQDQPQQNTNQQPPQQQLLHPNSNSKRSGMGSPPVTHSIASQLMLRTARGQRQYDVPQIECPSAIDGMERFACPTPDLQGRYRCIDDHVLCDGFIDCPEGEDEDRRSCMFYKTTKAHLDVLADALLRWARGR